MTPQDSANIYEDHIPYQDPYNQKEFCRAVSVLEGATSKDENLLEAILAHQLTPSDDDGPGPEFNEIKRLVGKTWYCDFGIDFCRGANSSNPEWQSIVDDILRKNLNKITVGDDRFVRVQKVIRDAPSFAPSLFRYLTDEVKIKLWLSQTKDFRSNNWGSLLNQCPVSFAALAPHFDGSEDSSFILAMVEKCKSWEFILAALQAHERLRNSLTRELFREDARLDPQKAPYCTSGFESVFEICLPEIMAEMRTNKKLIPFIAGRNNLRNAIPRIIERDKDHFSYSNTLFVLNAIGTSEVNEFHLQLFKAQNPLNPELLGNLPERYPDFPVEEIFAFVEEHPELLDCLLRSPRLAAIATLFPERTVSILLKRIEDVNQHRIALQPRPSCCVIPSGNFEYDLGHEQILDFGELLRGREDLLAHIVNPPIEILGLVGTHEALSRAEGLFSQLPIGIDDNECKSQVSAFPIFRKSQVTELAYLCQFPGNHKWLRSIIAKRRDLIRYFIEGGIEKHVYSRGRVEEFFVDILEEIDLIPEIFNRYATKNRDLVHAWYNLIIRLVPDCNPVEFTIKFIDEREVVKNYLVEGVVKQELKKYIESRKFNEAMNLVNVTHQYSNHSGNYKYEEIIRILEYCSETIKYIADELKNYEVQISARRPGSIFEKNRDELINQEKEILRKIENETKSYYALLTICDSIANDSKIKKLLEFLLPIDRSIYFRQIQELYERRHSVPDTKDLGLVDVILQAGEERIFDKMTRFASDEGLDSSSLKEALDGSYPSRSTLEKVLVRKFDWPSSKDGNKTFKFLDRLDDDLLPGLLRTGILSLVRVDGNPWDANSDLSRMLRKIYPDYCQPWARAICRVLDDHESLDPKWVKALCICLSLLREPVGSKVPLKLKELANHPRYLSFQDVLQQQAAQFNRENLKKGQARRDELKVKDAKQYLAKTSRMVHA